MTRWVSFVRGTPINYNDPSGHCPFCIIVGGMAIGAYYIGVGFGLSADLVGIAQAEAAMGGNGGSIEVAAGLAAQGEFSGPLDNVAAYIMHGDPYSNESGFGLAQTNQEELSALGFENADPTDPTTAVNVMNARRENARAACIDCTDLDYFVVTALHENGMMDLSTINNESAFANGNGINWSEYLNRQSTSAGQIDAQFRSNNFKKFIIGKYVMDLIELHRRGWKLPDGITIEHLTQLQGIANDE